METQRLLLLRNLTSTLAKTADLSERRPQQHNSTIKRKNTYNSFQTCANTDSKCSDEERCKFMENRFHVDFLLFCLLETRIHATTDANRRAGFFMHLFSICVNHITFWFHPLLCHYGITMWNMSLAFFVAFICPINNLGKIEGGGGIKSTFEQIWSAAWWPGLGGQQVSDARTRRKLAQIHENLLWLCQWNTQFTIHRHSIVSFLELKLKLCVSTATLS